MHAQVPIPNRVREFELCRILWADSLPRAERPYKAIEPGGLIFGLIHLRSSTFISIQINGIVQVANVDGIRPTVVPTPENRKVSDGAHGTALRRTPAASYPVTYSYDIHIKDEYRRPC